MEFFTENLELVSPVALDKEIILPEGKELIAVQVQSLDANKFASEDFVKISIGSDSARFVLSADNAAKNGMVEWYGSIKIPPGLHLFIETLGSEAAAYVAISYAVGVVGEVLGVDRGSGLTRVINGGQLTYITFDSVPDAKYLDFIPVTPFGAVVERASMVHDDIAPRDAYWGMGNPAGTSIIFEPPLSLAGSTDYPWVQYMRQQLDSGWRLRAYIPALGAGKKITLKIMYRYFALN